MRVTVLAGVVCVGVLFGVWTVAAQTEMELEGVVEQLQGECPTVSFVTGDTSVSTDDDTEFDGVSCREITNGIEVEVEGNRGADGSVRASEIEMDAADDDDNDDDRDDENGSDDDRS